jgi:twitching motility protein PilT
MDIKQYFNIAIARGAADLHLVGGSVPALRINEDLIQIDGDEPLDGEVLKQAIYSILSKEQIVNFEKYKDIDFSYQIDGSRFRVNIHMQEKKIGLTARLVPGDVPTPEFLRFSEALYNFTHLRDGFILVVGPSGSGKSSTLAAMINIINRERKAHIITIEDPIEFLFKEKQSIIEQRELGLDTYTFAGALRSALRQDPNVIMVGEMRDIETVSAAITAAETGHLILSTLHTSTASETIQRIVDFYPAEKQNQILNQLASNLRAVIAQELLPCKDGGRVVAREILINNTATANLIRRNQIEQIESVIQTSRKEGMITMNDAIDILVTEGMIDPKIADNRKRDISTRSAYY